MKNYTLMKYLIYFNFIVCCSLFVFPSIFAQTIIWEKKLGGEYRDDVHSIAQSIGEGVVFAGYSYSSGVGYDFYLGELDSVGMLKWDKTYGGGGHDISLKIIKTSDGGYLIGGSSDSDDGDITDGNNGNDDMWLVKVDADGIKQWDKTYGGTRLERLRSIIETPDGEFMLSGYTDSNNIDIEDGNYGYFDICIIKISSNGDYQWNKTYGGTRRDQSLSMVSTSDGGYIIGGRTESSDFDLADNVVNLGIDSEQHGDMWIIKIDEFGEKQWDANYGGSMNDSLLDITMASDGGFILTGHSNSSDGDFPSNYGEEDIWVVKIDDLGNILWKKNYGGSGEDKASAIVATQDGGYIVLGNTNSVDYDIENNYGDMDILLLKLDAKGEIEWSKNFGSSDLDTGHSILQNPDGSFIVAGSSQFIDFDIGTNINSRDGWIFKVNEPLVDNIDYSFSTGFQLYQNFPNPSDELTNIRFTKLTQNTMLLVTDIRGKKVLEKNIPFNSESITLNTSKLASGIYFYQLYTEQNQVVKPQKMLVVH